MAYLLQNLHEEFSIKSFEKHFLNETLIPEGGRDGCLCVFVVNFVDVFVIGI